MNVTGQNITDIISYLYEKRLGKQAEPDVLESWSNLSDEEARLHLRQLFASWGLDEPQMQGILKEYERDLMFKQAEVAPSEASIDTPDDSSISYTPQVETGSIFTEAPTTAAKPKKEDINSRGFFYWSSSLQLLTFFSNISNSNNCPLCM